MRRTTLTALGLLGALLALGCGDHASPQGETDSTTRALLNQTPVGGPSTIFDPDTTLTGQAPQQVDIVSLGYNLGAREAPVKIIEFSDFGCGYCRRFHQETFATIRKEFIDTGKYEWKFMPFITGMFKNSTAVTEAAECTLEQSPEEFEALSNRLWSDQPEWKGSSDPESVVRGWVDDLDVDMDRFDSCLKEDRRMSRIHQDTYVAQLVGVRGTPTFLIVGYGPVQGALPLEAFRGILGSIYDDAMAQRGDSGQATGTGPAAIPTAPDSAP